MTVHSFSQVRRLPSTVIETISAGVSVEVFCNVVYLIRQKRTL